MITVMVVLTLAVRMIDKFDWSDETKKFIRFWLLVIILLSFDLFLVVMCISCGALYVE